MIIRGPFMAIRVQQRCSHPEAHASEVMRALLFPSASELRFCELKTCVEGIKNNSVKVCAV